MKKIVMLLLIGLCLSPISMAQSYDDDLYYTPKKTDSSQKESESKKANVERHTYTSSSMPVVVKDRKGNVRDVDEYNRRYDSSDNNFEVADDTLYVNEKEEEDPENNGEWVNGFNGSQDDYEYAQRIIRFRNPRFAVSISSPYYWDIVYGLSSWDWNIYVDDYYAYAFPTFTNNLWSDWRFGSFGMGWGWGWNDPYYGGYWGGYYGGFYGGYYGGGWGHHNGWYGGGGYWAGNRGGSYNNRRSDFGSTYTRASSSNRRTSEYSRAGGTDRTGSYSTIRRSGSSGRVVGTRADNFSGVSRRSGYTRSESGYSDGTSRRSTYTRPSSTRTYSTNGEGIDRRSSTYTRPESSSRSSSYTRGSSNTTRSYSTGESSSRRSSSYDNSSSRSSSRSYSPSSSGSSRSSVSSGGGSSRSGGSSGGGSSRSGRR